MLIAQLTSSKLPSKHLGHRTLLIEYEIGPAYFVGYDSHLASKKVGLNLQHVSSSKNNYLHTTYIVRTYLEALQMNFSLSIV